MNSPPAFSAVARAYDHTFTETAVGKLQRERVWRLLQLHSTHQTPSILEINCGTGADALWMARRGWQVLATDISPAMVEITRKKLEQNGLTGRADARVCSFADIGHLQEGPFDLIFSNFGGLNCISPEALAQLWRALSGKLNPGGQIMVVVMGRFCWWETLYFLCKGNPKQAFRRRSRSPVAARLDENTTVETWYYSAKELIMAAPASAGLMAREVHPIGFWLPPSYLDPFFAKRPRLLRWLHMLESRFTPRWLTPAADHYLLRWEKPG